MKIIASVKFNSRKAYVVDSEAEYKYYRLGSDIIYGTDGFRYICYKYLRPTATSKAFGGRKFNLKIEDTGEIIECYGQWWDDGYRELSKALGLCLVSFTHNTIDSLKNCYVFYSSVVSNTALKQLLRDDIFYYDYYKYKRLLDYKELLSKLHRTKNKRDRDVNSLVKQCKRLSDKTKYFKNQIILNYE